MAHRLYGWLIFLIPYLCWFILIDTATLFIVRVHLVLLKDIKRMSFFLAVCCTVVTSEEKLRSNEVITPTMHTLNYVMAKEPSVLPGLVLVQPKPEAYMFMEEKPAPSAAVKDVAYNLGESARGHAYAGSNYANNYGDADDPGDIMDNEYNIMYDDYAGDYPTLSREKRGRRKDSLKKNKDRFDNTLEPPTPNRSGKGFSYEYYIKRRILKGYDRTTRPVRNDTDPITVSVGMSLYHILDTVGIPANKYDILSISIPVSNQTSLWQKWHFLWGTLPRGKIEN